ncbi:MAG: hypothetical protein N2450_08705 [bacterium]|nr:hypothetical protein [bacterium]
MCSDNLENWGLWDNPLAEIEQFIHAAPTRAIAEEMYRLVLRDVVTEYMLENGHNPLETEQLRIVLAEEYTMLSARAQQRLLQICAAIASKEG